MCADDDLHKLCGSVNATAQPEQSDCPLVRPIDGHALIFLHEKRELHVVPSTSVHRLAQDGRGSCGVTMNAWLKQEVMRSFRDSGAS